VTSPIPAGGESPSTLIELIEVASSSRLSFIGETGSVEAGTETWSAAETHERSDFVAGQLLACGLEPGQAVGLLLVDHRSTVPAFLGSLRAGLIPTLIAPPHPGADLSEWTHQLKHLAAIGSFVSVITTNSIAALLPHDSLGTPTLTLEFVAEHESVSDRPGIVPGADAFRQRTSGTTGLPKLIRVTHAAAVANIKAIINHGVRAGSNDRSVSWLPFYHDMGLVGQLLAPLASGTPTWYLPTTSFARRPASWGSLMSQVAATVSFAPNFAYEALVRRTKPAKVAGWDLSSWKVAGCGAEPIQPATLEQVATQLAPAGFRPEAFLPCYGLAETVLAASFGRLDAVPTIIEADIDAFEGGGMIRSAQPGAGARRFVSCGLPLADHEIHITDPNSGQELEDGLVGEITLSGPSITAGYLGDPDENAARFTEAGLRTGDLGALVDGELVVTGRSKDLIIVAGRNICPYQIEQTITDACRLPFGRAVVVARSNNLGTEEAVLVTDLPKTNLDDMLDASRDAVTGAHGISIAEALRWPAGRFPRTTSGKTRRVVVEQWAAHQDASTATAQINSDEP
jgi:fatty-acyl-CoA synthase